MNACPAISDTELTTALAYAARLAATRGQREPVFIEMFARLEGIAEQRKAQESALDRARRMAGIM